MSLWLATPVAKRVHHDLGHVCPRKEYAATRSPLVAVNTILRPSQKLLRIGFAGFGLMPMKPMRILS